MLTEYLLSVGHCSKYSACELPTTRARKHQVHLLSVYTTANTMNIILKKCVLNPNEINSIAKRGRQMREVRYKKHFS